LFSADNLLLTLPETEEAELGKNFCLLGVNRSNFAWCELNIISLVELN
jgi:hypothetical protein